MKIRIKTTLIEIELEDEPTIGTYNSNRYLQRQRVLQFFNTSIFKK